MPLTEFSSTYETFHRWSLSNDRREKHDQAAIQAARAATSACGAAAPRTGERKSTGSVLAAPGTTYTSQEKELAWARRLPCWIWVVGLSLASVGWASDPPALPQSARILDRIEQSRNKRTPADMEAARSLNAQGDRAYRPIGNETTRLRSAHIPTPIRTIRTRTPTS